MPPKTTSKPKNVKKTNVAKNKKVVKTPPSVVETPVSTDTVSMDTVSMDTVSMDTVSTDTVSADTVVSTSVDAVSATPYLDEFSSLMTELDNAVTLIKSLKSRVVKLEKQVHRDSKVMAKKLRGRKNRVRDPNAPKSGFAKAGPVSSDMSKFLGLSMDELISRTDVTKRIHTYCKTHNLQNPEDKRKITPDSSLKKLLNIPKGDELTFFNLQKYMKVHFPNKEGVYPTL